VLESKPGPRAPLALTEHKLSSTQFGGHAQPAMASAPGSPEYKNPTVEELCAELGQGQDVRKLLGLAHAWRKLYICQDGSFGTSLVNWRLHRQQLNEMAVGFVNGHGHMLWPDQSNGRYRCTADNDM
jgi:hypothetical protein